MTESNVANSGSVLVGIFVGGESRRMGQPKGLLRAPASDVTLVERLAQQARTAFKRSSCVLVGDNASYDSLDFCRLADPVSHQGPLAGVVAVLAEAKRRGVDFALVLGCDFPYLRANFLRRLVDEEKEAEVVCPYLDDRYQPLVARYSTSLLPRCEEALRSGERALQRLLRRANVATLPLTSVEAESLTDWNRPEDMGHPRGAKL